MQETLIGEVEIICRLIPWSARVRNIFAATPGCERMPAPTRDTLPRSWFSSTANAPSCACVPSSARAGRGHVLGRHRERHLGVPVHDVLDDRVDVDVRRRDDVEDHRRHARAIGDTGQGEHDIVLAVCHRRDDRLLHLVSFLNPCSLLVREGRAGVNADAVIAGELDRAEHQHLGARRGHLEHLLVRDHSELARLGDDARIGGEDARHVGVDLARRAQRRCESDGRGVRAAASERGDVHRVAREALEAGDEDDLAAVERFSHAIGADLPDLRFRVRGVGEDARLRAGERDGLLAEVVDRHRHERAGDALAGREQHVELATVGGGGDLVGEVDQPVRGLAHRRDRADDPQAAFLGGGEPARHMPDLLRVGNGRAAELHHDGVELHRPSVPTYSRRRARSDAAERLRPPVASVRSADERRQDVQSGPRTSSTATARAAPPRARPGARAARRRAVLLARRARARGVRSRDSRRRVRVPPAGAGGLRALRAAAEGRQLRRLHLPRRVRRLGRGRRGRPRRGALLLLRPLPRHASSGCRPFAGRAPRALREARHARDRPRAAAPRGRGRARRQLLPPPHRHRRPHRRARGRDLRQRRRRTAAGDLLDEASPRRHAQGGRSSARPVRIDRRSASSRCRA